MLISTSKFRIRSKNSASNFRFFCSLTMFFLFVSAWVAFTSPIFLTGFRSIKCIQNKLRHKLNKYRPTRKAGCPSVFSVFARLASEMTRKGKNGWSEEIRLECQEMEFSQTARCQINAKVQFYFIRIATYSNQLFKWHLTDFLWL